MSQPSPARRSDEDGVISAVGLGSAFGQEVLDEGAMVDLGVRRGLPEGWCVLDEGLPPPSENPDDPVQILGCGNGGDHMVTLSGRRLVAAEHPVLPQSGRADERAPAWGCGMASIVVSKASAKLADFIGAGSGPAKPCTTMLTVPASSG